MWVLVGGYLVIAVRVVVLDRRLVVLIRVMACAPLPGQKSIAGTIRPNQCLWLGCLALTRTWAGENTVGWCRGRRRLTQNLCRRALVSDPSSLLVAARHAVVQEHMDGLPLE